MNFKNIRIYLIPILFILLAGCGKVSDINIKAINEVKFRGLQQNIVMLSLEVDIDNPNVRKLSITDIEFIAWLNDRELGIFRITEQVKLIPCSRKPYTIPVEIELRTIADAFKLVTSGSIEGLLDRIEVEGFIKGKSGLLKKKILVPRQSFTNLTSSF